MSGLKSYVPWVVFATLGIVAIDILLKLAGTASTITAFIDYIAAFLGFADLLLTVFMYNEFKFKSMLDLGILTFIIVAIGIILGTSVSLVQFGFIGTVFAGFIPLLAGVFVGGIITIPVGLLRLKQHKPGKH